MRFFCRNPTLWSVGVFGLHGFLLGLVYRAVGMLRRGVDRIEFQRLVAFVDDVVPLPGRDEDRIVVFHVAYEVELILAVAIITCAIPSSMRRNWSMPMCCSNPTSPPTGIVISVTCRLLPVQSTVLKFSFPSV